MFDVRLSQSVLLQPIFLKELLGGHGNTVLIVVVAVIRVEAVEVLVGGEAGK